MWAQNRRELLWAGRGHAVRAASRKHSRGTYHLWPCVMSLLDGKLLEGRSFLGLGAPVPYT